MVRNVGVLSTGMYVPARRVTNAEIEARLGQKVDQWLVDNVGIKARHFMAAEESTSDLATHAARDALERAGVHPEEVDLLIVATDTPDQPSPATSAVVQARLGAVGAGTFDVSAACASWVTALDVACRRVMTDPTCRRVLVVGAYGMSRFLDPMDKTTCTLFADGAGAVLVGPREAPGFLAGYQWADGTYADALGIYVGGARLPASPDNVAHLGPPTVRFVRRFPATFNLTHWPRVLQEALKRAGMTVEDVDLFLFTQLNLRTIEAVMAELGQPMSKTHWIMDRFGYTGSACIPMALHEAAEQGRIRPGQVVALCASGGGIAMSSAVLRW